MDTTKKILNAVQWVRKRRDEMYEEWKKDPKAFDESVGKAGEDFKKRFAEARRKRKQAA